MGLKEKQKELNELADRAEAILAEMEAADQGEAPKRALEDKKRMGSKKRRFENKGQRRQLEELEKENY